MKILCLYNLNIIKYKLKTRKMGSTLILVHMTALALEAQLILPIFLFYNNGEKSDQNCEKSLI